MAEMDASTRFELVEGGIGLRERRRARALRIAEGACRVALHVIWPVAGGAVASLMFGGEVAFTLVGVGAGAVIGVLFAEV